MHSLHQRFQAVQDKVTYEPEEDYRDYIKIVIVIQRRNSIENTANEKVQACVSISKMASLLIYCSEKPRYITFTSKNISLYYDKTRNSHRVDCGEGPTG